MEIRPGVYDQIITESIRLELNRLAQLTDVESLVIDLEEASASDYLARHITQQIRMALKALSRLDSDQPDARANLVNSVIQQVLYRQSMLRRPHPFDQPRRSVSATSS